MLLIVDLLDSINTINQNSVKSGCAAVLDSDNRNSKQNASHKQGFSSSFTGM